MVQFRENSQCNGLCRHTHVVERIMKVRKRELADEARKVVRSFSPRSALRSAEGELFKMIGTALFSGYVLRCTSDRYSPHDHDRLIYRV